MTNVRSSSKRSTVGRRAAKAGSVWENQVIGTAQALGWHAASFRSVLVRRGDGSCYYATPVQGDGVGWPDVVLVKGARILFRELKTDRATVSKKQKAWLERLAVAGCDVGVWRPRDWDAIVLELGAAVR